MLRLLRAAVGELSRGTGRVRHVLEAINGMKSSYGKAAVILGKRTGTTASICVA